MPKTANKVSFLIESQLPDFINEEYELFGKFIQKYYEQIELQGQPLDIVHNMQTYRDIDFYERNVLKQSTTTTDYLQDTDTSIEVNDASSFPQNGGYIKINEEICFYKTRTDTKFLNVSRGVSGNTRLGDLYEKSTFVTTQADNHILGSTVQNISNLFLYSLIKSFEKQYLSNFPEAYLKGDIDKRTLIKNITSFYKTKGTENSIKFLFKCLIDNDPEPEVLYPRDSTLKASESNWINNYSLKAKIISGDPNDLIGKVITQTTGDHASAVVDNVRYSGKYDNEDLYEIILAESTINGKFSVAAKTVLRSAITSTMGAGDKVEVFSTIGWDTTGKFSIDGEVFTFDDKNVNQFVIKTRTGTGVHSIGESVTFGSDVSGNGVELLVFGVVYNLESTKGVPYSDTGDTIDVSEPGFITDDPKIFDTQNNIRWDLYGIPQATGLDSNVSAIYEDSDSYYIASSGFPSHVIGTLPVDAKDQKHLKIIRKNPISTTEIYETKYRDVGIATNGVPFASYKDEEVILNGPLQTITVGNRGNGYKKPPYVIIDGVGGLASSSLAGEVLESVSIVTEGSYTDTPTVEILSGRNASVTAIITGGEITSLSIDNAGEYYSSIPEIRIADLAGKGQFASYTAEISNDGKLINCIKVNGGKGYTQGNVLIDIISVGSGATATASIKEWRKDRFKKSTVDFDNGAYLQNYIPSNGVGYSYYASPSTLRANDNGAQHSPILGFAYDGNPIYGAYGYTNPLDQSSAITRMTSSYSLSIVRDGGPLEADYPLGTFIQDWTYIHNKGSLDQNNGRFCITPDFPNGTYAYFITVDSTNVPVFPYILGENYYSLPVDSNYNSELSQDDLPSTARRLRTSAMSGKNNGDGTSLLIGEVSRGTISSGIVENSGTNFTVGSKLIIDNTGTDGYGAEAEVESVTGKSVISIKSQSDKVLYINLSDTAYLFDGDRVIQGTSEGYVVGDVFNGNRFAIEDVTGEWVNSGTLTSDTKVVTLLLDKDSSYTKGAILSLGDGVNLPVAKGEILETTSSQNSVKIKVTDDGFVISNSLYLSSSDLLNTPGSKIISITSLSENLDISSVQDNVALIKTSVPHNVAEGEKINIDINPLDSTTTTTHEVRSTIYQEAIVEIPVIARVLNDSGIGRFDILNGGADYTPGTAYTDIALSGGNGTGAKATIEVSAAGIVNKVIISNRGSGYKKYDILTVGDSDLGKTNSNTASLKIEVDHAGFASESDKLNVDSSLGLSIGDQLIIGSETVVVETIAGNILEVTRGDNPVDHYDGTAVTLVDAGFNFTVGYQINQETADTTQPYIVSYDTSTQKIVFKYGYGLSYDDITKLTLSSVFKDQSQPINRIVNIKNVTDPQFYYEIDGERNKIIDVKKYYKYNFDISHSSMSGKKFDISPSINFNVNTPEKLTSSNIVDFKLGFGVRTSSNTYTKKVDNQYNKYYYFDNNNIVDSEKSYLNIVDDPLQGEKTILYVTPTKILYSTDVSATHDGTGVIKYDTKSPFAVGAIKSINVTNIGIDYKKLPIVTGIYDADGIIDNTVKCYLSSKDIGIPSNIKIINNGGAYHSDTSLSSTFRSNTVMVLSNFGIKPFSVGETIIQKIGSVEVARAKVSSWREGSNILIVHKVNGSFRNNEPIIGLAGNNSAVIEDISYTEFSPVVQTNFDNVGYYSSDSGKVSDANQKIHDSYYYQDYSYTIKSKTPIETWRKLIKETTHPAGFKLFGEILIESDAKARMSDTPALSRVSVIQAWNPDKNKITVESVRKQITQSIVLLDNLNVEKGVGSIALDTLNSSEIVAGGVGITGSFDGAYSNKGNLEGTTQFTLVDSDNNVVTPYNDQALVVTLDGILQEPGVAYTITNDKINFAQPPLTGVTFYAKKFQFKTDGLNFKYLKKIRNIFQRNGRWLDAANQLERNREYIQETTLAHIKSVHTNLSWNSLSTKCFRDIGFIVDALAHDLRFGGNEKTKRSVEKYFNNGVLDYIDGELEPTLEAFEHAVGIAKEAINNELTSGYIDPDILTDTGPTKCADVVAALDTLYDVIRSIMTTGPDAVETGYPDYINGDNTIFDLFYTDGSPVETIENEDLFLTLSGVLQTKNSYTIDRNYIPNRVVFDEPPIWGQSGNTKNVYEPLAVEKFFGQGIGSYNRCTIDTSISSVGSTGPFLIKDLEGKIKSVDDPRFTLVFVDGVLQRDGVSYSISGPAIRFNTRIFSENNIDIITLYGRDAETALTLYDYERNQYYNEIQLTCDAGSPNDFIDWVTWYNLSHNDHQVAYQKINGVRKFIGNVKLYTKTANTLIVTIAGSNHTLDASNVFFAGKPDFSDEYELTGTTDSISIVRDDLNDYQMQRNSARWLYGTPRADDAFFERKRGGANLRNGDLIKIDGEEEWRTVNKLPRYVRPKNYNLDGDVSNDFHGNVLVTKYGGDTRGTGLSVECQLTGDKVTSITWNKNDNVVNGYDSTPVLQFIPVDKNGGGAKAEVIVQHGTVVDIVITDGGFGYTTSPRVVVTRQYNVIKKNGRKIDSLVELDFENRILVDNLNVHVIITPIKGVDPCVSCVGTDPLLPDLPGDGDGTHKDYPWADASWTGKMIQITNIFDLKFTLPAPVAIPQEIVRYWPTVVDSVTVPPCGDLTSLGISILELGPLDLRMGFSTWIDKETDKRPGPPIPGPVNGMPPSPGEEVTTYQLGFVDHRHYDPSVNTRIPPLHNMTMRPAFFMWEGAKFMDTGDITITWTDNSQNPPVDITHSVSEYTIEEFDRYGFQLLEFSDYAGSGWANDGYSMNVAYPTINNYLSQLDTSDLPDANGAGYIATGAVVYCNTTNFPATGKILIGKETISYTSKLTDRFIGCTRGVDGSPIESHTVGDFIRSTK